MASRAFGLLCVCAAAHAVIVVRPAAPDELLRLARFRAAAFSTDGRTASPARAQAVHKLVEDRIARGSTLLCALASGSDADCLEAEPEGGGWHPGLEGSQPLKLLSSFFKSEPGATLDESLDDCRIVGVCDVSRHEFDLPTHSLAPDYALYLTALAVHPALRRRGVAASLLEAVDAHARGEGLGRVILHVEDDNAEAIAFYEAQAFAQMRVDKDLRQFGTALGLNPDIHSLFSRDVVS
jgi:ribosomal protein S18 acetylase RimI-like enzyme